MLLSLNHLISTSLSFFKKLNNSFNPNLGGKGGNFTPLLCWYSLNNSETVKPVIMVFFRIQYHFRAIHVKFGISNSSPSPNIGQNSDRGISNLQIAGRSLIKENYHNSRTSDDIDMITSCQQIVTSLFFFRFMVNLEQSGSRIPDA